MNEIVKVCKVHGELTIDQTTKRYDHNKSLKCKKCQQKWTNNYLKNNKGKYQQIYRYSEKSILNRLKNNLKARNNITLDQYNNLLLKQSNLCAICKMPETKIDYRRNITVRLSVDHCHNTGKIRGLLCDRCNISLGRLNDSIEILQSAIDYLIKNR